MGGAGDVVDPEETGPETMDIHITRITAGNIIQMVLTLAEIMTVQDNMKTRSMKNLQHHSMLYEPRDTRGVSQSFNFKNAPMVKGSRNKKISKSFI